MRFAFYDSSRNGWRVLSTPQPGERIPNGQFYVVGAVQQSGDYAIILEAQDFPGWGIFLIVLGALIVLVVCIIFVARLVLRCRRK